MAARAVIANKTISTEQGRLDWFGILCSFGCAIHCAAMPVLISTLPSLTTLRWLADPLFHQCVAVLCGILVIRAILPGYRKHRDSRVLTWAGIGLSLLFVAAFILPDACCLEQTQMPNRAIAFHLDVESVSPLPKILLVSSVGSSSENSLSCGQFSHQDYRFGGSNRVCEGAKCLHGPTFSRALLTAFELEEQLGPSGARTLIRAQPFLSPIGGLLLILAHIFNVRLQCCKRSMCGR